MRLLFIKLRHIGDALLMTSALAAARRKYPDAQIWVVVRKGCEGILKGCPAIDRILTTAPAERESRMNLDWWRDLQVIRELRAQRFDYAFELSDNSRGRWFAWLSGAKQVGADEGPTPIGGWWQKRFAILRMPIVERKQMHRAEKDFRITHNVLPLDGDTPPMQFQSGRTVPWDNAPVRQPFVVFHPGTRWLRKRWPRERWTELGRQLSGRGFQIVISAGPDAAEIAEGEELSQSIGSGAISTTGKLNWAQLAWLLHRARLFVGVDTAAMHLAAACQCPSVALFGPSWVPAWHPWKTPHRVVRPSAEAQLQTDAKDPDEIQRELTGKILLADVISACDAVLAETESTRGQAGLRAST